MKPQTMEEENLKLKQRVKELEERIKELEGRPKGKGCSTSGNIYETTVYEVVKACELGRKPFNTQTPYDLGGSSAGNDIECNFKGERDIGIEVKRYNTPDWMQCRLSWDGKWVTSDKGKIPEKCRELFLELVNGKNPFGGEVPPFFDRKLKYSEWTEIKKGTSKWNDVYYDIPSDSIRKLYSLKGCQYIQVSGGYGLYHLGEDVCKFGVPVFEVKQRLRVRIKVHTRKNKQGYCDLSITASCQPRGMEELEPSPYSLDKKDKIPPTLKLK